MRTKISIILLIGLSLLLNNSCRKNENSCNLAVFKFSPVSHVEGPNLAQLNQEIQLIVNAVGYDGCTQLSGAKFQESKDGFTRTIQAMTIHQGCACTLALVNVPIIYTFKASQPGEYTLKFSGYDNQYKEHVITVQ